MPERNTAARAVTENTTTSTKYTYNYTNLPPLAMVGAVTEAEAFSARPDWIHLVARATDAALVRGQTIRVLVANADALAKRKDVIERFMKAYRESIDYMYSSNPQVITDYAEFAKVPEPMAKRVRDEFFPKSLVNPDQIHGLDSLIPEAVNLKFIPAPLTKEQTAELIRISPRQ